MSRQNSLDKLHIELYSLDGIFQGYASHVSEAKNKIDICQDKYNALYFSNMSTAAKCCEKIQTISRGCLRCEVN
jgi:hypothetical protein